MDKVEIVVPAVFPSPEEIDSMIERLVDKIRPTQDVWPPRFDIVVGIENGGVHISRKIAAALKLPHTSVRISHYNGMKLRDEPYVGDWSFHCDLHKSCLVVDDLVDSGSTIFTFKKHFGFRDGVDSVAVLFYKSRSKYKPEFFVAQEDKWVVFPWESTNKG